MKCSDRNTQDNSTDNTASDNTDARWEPIPDEIWFSSPAGGFGMESDWEVTADMQEDEETRLIQPDRQKSKFRLPQNQPPRLLLSHIRMLFRLEQMKRIALLTTLLMDLMVLMTQGLQTMPR